jgi:hypothetical protein
VVDLLLGGHGGWEKGGVHVPSIDVER